MPTEESLFYQKVHTIPQKDIPHLVEMKCEECIEIFSWLKSKIDGICCITVTIEHLIAFNCSTVPVI